MLSYSVSHGPGLACSTDSELGTGPVHKLIYKRLPAQNFLSQLSFYINYVGEAHDSPKSLAADFMERPSGVMSTVVRWSKLP